MMETIIIYGIAIGIVAIFFAISAYFTYQKNLKQKRASRKNMASQPYGRMTSGIMPA